MNNLKFLIFLFLIIGCNQPKIIPLDDAHAHNDYEHDKPLFDALQNGFTSVEVDVHLINNEFYVSHFTPEKLEASKTLENLYLKPLSQHIKEMDGRVYKGYEDYFYLMIDIKTEAQSGYEKLKTILEDYNNIISCGKDKKPVKLVITGTKGRPYKQILSDETNCLSLDGRFVELGEDISAIKMPFISEKYSNYFSFLGDRKPYIDEVTTLKKMVNATHKENKKLRFWASPENINVWKFLLENGVDLINTDSLKKFNDFRKNQIKK